MPLKPNTFRMSLPKVIMVANTFTMSILRVPLKPLLGCHFRNDNDCQCFYFTKTSTFKKRQNKIVACKAKLKIDVTRQAKFIGDSYIAASARSRRYMNYRCISITIKHYFQRGAHRLAIRITSRHRNNICF